MSEKQINISLDMVKEAQETLGHEIDEALFAELLGVISASKDGINKDAQRIIKEMVHSKKNQEIE